MRIGFQADNDLNARIIDAIQRLNQAIEFETAARVGFHTGSSDPEVLRVSAEAGRVLVSHDLRTLPWHFASFVETQNSPGVIIISQKPIVRNIVLENTKSSASPRVMWIVSFPGAVIEEVRFVNCTFRGVEATEVLQNVGSISFKNITIEPAKKTPTRNSRSTWP